VVSANIVFPAKEGVKKLFFPRNVIPGRLEGPSPEPKNICISKMFDVRCSWVPGSRAVPAPRNDDVWYFFTRSKAGTHLGCGHRLEPVLGPAIGRTRGQVWRDFWRYH
jgi:hypothetical protein